MHAPVAVGRHGKVVGTSIILVTASTHIFIKGGRLYLVGIYARRFSMVTRVAQCCSSSHDLCHCQREHCGERDKEKERERKREREREREREIIIIKKERFRRKAD